MQAHYANIVSLYTENADFSSMVSPSFFDGFNTDKERAEHVLTNFGCKDLSWAIHTLTGWEVWEFGDDENTHWFHSVCKIPDSDLIIDGKGIRTIDSMLNDYREHTYSVDTDAEPFFLGDDELDSLMQYGSYLISQSNLVSPLL